MQWRRMLVAMDDSEASRRMLPVVAARACETDGLRVVLCHVLPPLPPELLETRGAEDPREQRRIEHAQELRQAQWVSDRAAEGARLVAEAKLTLEARGVPAERIDADITEPIDSHERLADAIVDEARAQGCRTIVVGRRSFPVLREVLHTHLDDELRRRADGLDVWTVEA